MFLYKINTFLQLVILNTPVHIELLYYSKLILFIIQNSKIKLKIILTIIKIVSEMILSGYFILSLILLFEYAIFSTQLYL